MGVSKIAVIALVAIVAVPILLGYAMNIEQITENDYKTTGEAVNVTPLLQTSTAYSYAHADPLQMNTQFLVGGTYSPMIPIYESYSTNKTSLKATYYVAPTNYAPGGPYLFDNYTVYYWQFNYNMNNCHLQISVTDNNNTVYSYANVHTVYFDYSDHSVKLTRYLSTNSIASATVSNAKSVTYTATGTWYANSYQIYNTAATTDYVNISAGYRFTTIPGNGVPYSGSRTNLPDYTRSVLFTLDLSSITATSYEFNINNIVFTKTTTAGVVTWTVSDNVSQFDPFDIYYDQGSSNNTYQFRMTADTSGESVGSGMYNYGVDIQLRYVGAWPDLIGEANYYQSYEASTNIVQVGHLNYSMINLNTRSETSPVMRIDDAEFRAFEYPIIKDKTYNPADFKTNPSTTLNDLQAYGRSLEFGGNTYTVKDGNITLGTHQVPVRGLVLSSRPNQNGGYDNLIGNTVVSTTADPSTITFNGEWSASITTVAQEQYTTSKTEWVAGSFGWDGVDHNFKIVGLLTSVGAFIAIGIYARTSKKSVWPLLIVCGGAAALFFAML